MINDGEYLINTCEDPQDKDSVSPEDTSDLSERVLDRAVQRLGGQLRDGQVTMVREVTRALNNGEHLLVQAGTGTGKSLGYLVPLLTDIAQGGSRGVVSTATLALQRQIISKDAPLAVSALKEVTGFEAQVCVLKGWQNYLCLYKVNGGFSAVQEDLFNASDISDLTKGQKTKRGPKTLSDQVKSLYKWAGQTTTGDRDDFDQSLNAHAWSQVSVSSSQCLAEQCPMRRECFVFQARGRAALADLIVTNHAMLGIVAAGNDDLLPEQCAVVIDEAHDLVEKVRSLARVEISGSRVDNLASALKKYGLNVSILRDLAARLDKELVALHQGRLEKIPQTLVEIFDGLQVDLAQASRSLPRKDSDIEKMAGAQVLRATISDLSAALSTFEPSLVAGGSQVVWVGAQGGERGALGHKAGGFSGAASLYSAPLQVADRLAERLFNDRSVVLTSATLELGGSFVPMASSSGFSLSDQPWRGVDVGSPFEMSKQAIIYVASDLPAPTPGDMSDLMLTRLAQLVRASSGGMLALFSSYRALDQAREFLEDNVDFPLLVQGQDNLPALVEDFASDEESCLLGTLSLWQGVDVPGRACRLVVMDKIPFPVPVDPLVQARSEDVQKRGGNAFYEVSLSHAALLLAQGAGRLLRSRTDKGVVAILDSRVATRSYGSYLRKSLPPMWYTQDSFKVLAALERLSQSS